MARLDLTRHPHGHGIINTQPSCEYFMSNSIQPFPSISIADAQRDMRSGYYGGAPGMLTSALMWLVAGVVAARISPERAVWALFLGGMLIFPVSKLVCRAVFHRENESYGNPLGMTVLECTIAMIGGLFAAWLFLPSKPMLVFPLSAIAVGTHYFVFKTVYGDRSFWLLAGIVTAIGFGDIYAAPMRGSTALLVSLTELAFGIILVIRATRSNRAAVAPID